MIARSGAADEPAACPSHHRFPALTRRASRLTVGLVAAGLLAACSAHPAGAAGSMITVSTGACGRLAGPAPGLQTFRIHNEASAAAEVDLVNPASGAIYAEVEALGPGHHQPDARSTLGSGTYAFRCVIEDIDPITGPAVKVGGHVARRPGHRAGHQQRPARRRPTSTTPTSPPAWRSLARQTAALAADVRRGDLAAAPRRPG